MQKQLVFRNPPQDILEAITAQMVEKTKRTRRPVSMTEAAYDLMRKGVKCDKNDENK